MLPTLIHQSFPSDRRIRVKFADSQCHDIYLADFDGLWLDTELLPLSSLLRYDVHGAHWDMLSRDLELRGISIEDAYSFSPSTRSLAFMLRVIWVPDAMGGPAVDVCYGYQAGKQSICRITLPQVTLTERTDTVSAAVDMCIAESDIPTI